MIIATIGCIGLMYCIFVMPFTQYAKDRMNNKFDYTMMYIYVGFLIMAILGFMLQIWLRLVQYAVPAISSRSRAASMRYVIYVVRVI